MLQSQFLPLGSDDLWINACLKDYICAVCLLSALDISGQFLCFASFLVRKILLEGWQLNLMDLMHKETFGLLPPLISRFDSAETVNHQNVLTKPCHNGWKL